MYFSHPHLVVIVEILEMPDRIRTLDDAGAEKTKTYFFLNFITLRRFECSIGRTDLSPYLKYFD